MRHRRRCLAVQMCLGGHRESEASVCRIDYGLGMAGRPVGVRFSAGSVVGYGGEQKLDLGPVEIPVEVDEAQRDRDRLARDHGSTSQNGTGRVGSGCLDTVHRF